MPAQRLFLLKPTRLNFMLSYKACASAISLVAPDVGEAGVAIPTGAGGTAGAVITGAVSTIVTGLYVPEINTGDKISNKIPI